MVDLPSLTFYQAYLHCSLCIIDSHFMIITESNQSFSVVIFYISLNCCFIPGIMSLPTCTFRSPMIIVGFFGSILLTILHKRHKIYLSHGWVCSPWVHVLISDVRFSACRLWPLIFILRYIGILLCYPCFSCSNGPTISSAFFPHPIPLYMTI